MTELAQSLLTCVLQGGGTASRLSVIGLSKNAGKTVTLNHVIKAADQARVPLGLVSTGRDGEQQDAITELPKPRIWAPAGAYIATARGALAAGTARVDILRELPVNTPFGPVVLGRTGTEGEVLLIGPGSAKRVGDLLGALEAMGARLCLVDGSFDRIAAASPDITGRVVLAAGAAYSHSLAETVAQVRHVLDVFDLPVVLPAIEASVEKALRRAPVSVVTSGGAITEVPVPSGLSDPETIVARALEARSEGAHLVLRGALGDRLLMTLVKKLAADVAVVVNDPTHILVERSLWRRWRRQGGQVYVRRPIRLLAITTNAHSPVGKDYDAQKFFESIAAIANRPVFDLMTGLAHSSTESGGALCP